MAIEIKELNVTLNIGGAKSNSGKGCSDCGDGNVDQNQLTEDAVKEVVRILKEQKER
jgi:hypothetical protein